MKQRYRERIVTKYVVRPFPFEVPEGLYDLVPNPHFSVRYVNSFRKSYKPGLMLPALTVMKFFGGNRAVASAHMNLSLSFMHLQLIFCALGMLAVGAVSGRCFAARRPAPPADADETADPAPLIK